MQQRLFRMVQLLVKHKHMTAKELSEHLEVSTRTIYRDLDALTLGGIPIYTQKGEGGGIYIDEHYVLSQTLINQQEQEAILQGLHLLKSTQARDTSRSSEKFEALFQRKQPDIIKIDFHAWGKDNRQEALFDMLYQAIHTRHIVSFTYYNSMKEKAHRKVEPYQLVFKEQAWYLVAYCLYRKNYRIFKFNRMVDVSIDNQIYDVKEIPEDVFPDLTYHTVNQVVLHFDKDVWFQLVDSFPIDMIKELNDCFEVVINCPEEDWLCSWLLSFEDHLEVISPQSLREKMQKRIKKMNNIYE